ncbi:unnamed protein product [Leptosia nina]|uniref:Connectin n=1 Tax=Leptosia nina TaxID=320188 RepID=A0AAV1J305_9NEOP
MKVKHFIVMIAFAIIEINLTESYENDRIRLKSEKTHYLPYVNVCDVQDRSSKVHCYCENPRYQSAKKADCWVFNGGIDEGDPFWSNFHSQPKLEKLTFNVRTDGGLSDIPSKVIVRLDHLQYLNIRYGQISCIPSFAFTNSTTLKEIILYKDKITELEKMAFANLIMLVNISLSDNQITEIEKDVFYFLPNLQRLNLARNTLEVLHDGCFKHLSNLIKLDLNNNLLTVVIRENFQGLANLITLNMGNNKLSMIGDLAFAELWSLQELYLENNEIKFISERGFGGLTQLRKLFLAGNKLETLDNGVFDDIQKLNVLDLRNNKLETLKQETLRSVADNMKSNYALIFLENNKLICDCRLSWLYKLRDETQSKKIRESLTQLECILDDALKNNLAYIKLQRNKTGQTSSKTTKMYDKEELGDYDVSQDRVIELDPTTGEFRKRLLNIPKNILPCPNHEYAPTQDEVKYYKTSGSGHNVTTWLTSMYILINLVRGWYSERF